ncbi:MAG: acetyl-CoA hydrolase/transferase family protein [Acidobacteria bacterium]|nr:acetyl-CoA hydrolase/transferase family protein [Acidobacteriota bacterium]MBI3663611.1 acetyl-CoA hydrolase/transferase family protein [Acidobacteriota bacterium]
MHWLDDYRKKQMTPEDALRCVQSGMRVYIQPGCAEPEVLAEALVHRAPFVRNVEIVHLLTLGRADYVAPEMAGHFRHNAMFIGANVRQAVNEGRADYTPIYLSEIESLFEDGAMPIDVALIQVSPPDPHGFCSFGVGIDTTLTAAKVAKYVVAQVNDQMPRTYGDSFIHVSNIHAIVDVSRPLCELPREEITPLQQAIARNVATLIQDGDTLQLGIGGIPDAVLLGLNDRKDLGIHTEMLSDSAVPLIQSGVINGSRKTLHPRKIILGFVLGTRQLFDYVNENPIFEFHPVSYTNNPFIIAQNDRMVAVNSTLQMDITGQVCSDSVGQYLYSGFGGQVDFIRGARHSKGGKPIIAMPSTAKNDTISRIVPTLTPGSGVVASRGSIHYVVTEYGIAYLHGKSIRERAEALIQIAHPNFRKQLYDYCEHTKWLQRPLAVLSELASTDPKR